MKKYLSAIIAALFAAAICTVSASAFSDSEFRELDIREAEGFQTVITDTEGVLHTLEGALSVKTLEECACSAKIANYEIVQKGRTVISVKLNDIIPKGVHLFDDDGTLMPGGYYSVRFTLSEAEGTEVFLTGLTDKNLHSVQEQLLAATLDNSRFSMEDLDFIDAEKTSLPNDGDNELCWAAGTANTLHYTGWAAKAGFSNEDDVLDLFRDSFTDFSGNAYFGHGWFFNASYMVQGRQGWSQVKDYGSSGGYLKDYDAFSVVDYFDISNDYKMLIHGIETLESGGGLSIGVSWMDNGQRVGGHLITAWGYIYDTDEDVLSKERYKAIIVSDSDSDQKAEPDRRSAPNKLQVLTMLPYNEYSYDSWYFDGFSDGVFSELITLEPYGADIEYETDEAATKDKLTSPDFTVTYVYSANAPLDVHMIDGIFSKGDVIYLRPVICNYSDGTYSGSVSIGVKVYDRSTGLEVSSTAARTSLECDSYAEDIKLGAVPISGLGVGEYTAKITVNSDKAVTEAYYYNNTHNFDFTVTEDVCDTSGAVISADIREILGFGTPFAISCEGVESLDVFSHPTAKYALMTSYLIDGVWRDYEYAKSPDGESLVGLTALPESFVAEAKGSAMKLRLLIYSSDDSFPTVNIYSEEYALRYSWLTVNADTSNTGSYTPIGSGARTLAEGEVFSFTVTNSSAFDGGTLNVNAVVYARSGDTKTEIFRRDGISLGYSETSEVLSFNSWEPELSGRYDIVALIDGDIGYDECILGKLAAAEAHTFTVTTEEDTEDEYDGEVSLREAVKYFELYGGRDGMISFGDTVSIIYLSSPIAVDGYVAIDGDGVILYGLLSTNILSVTETGEIIMVGTVLNSGYSEGRGGAIENLGGKVTLKGCRVLYCQSDVSGGAIYSEGGSLTLKNCALKGNISLEGAAIHAVGGATLNMLDCVVFQNSSNGAAVYCDSSNANILYSTFSSNTGTALGASGGSTNIFGSIAVLDDAGDISGDVNIYGCYYTEAESGVTVDEASVIGQANRIFRLSASGEVDWSAASKGSTFAYKARMSSLITNGITVRNDGGKISYSADGESFILTDADSAFTTEEYSLDLFGNTHGALFGAISTVHDKTEIINVTDGNIAEIYLPEARKVLLIERIRGDGDKVTDINLYRLTLDVGTNYINLGESSASGTKKYMLWDSADGITPLGETFGE